MPEKGRLFAILVSVAWHEIWCLRLDQVLTHPGKRHSQWLRPRDATRARHGHGRGNDGVSTAWAVSKRPVKWSRKFLTGLHGQRHGRDGSTAL
jgi:hypothetical protein